MKGRHEQAGKIVSNSNHPQAEVSDLDSLGHRPSLPSIRAMFPSAFTQNATAGEGGGPRADYPQYHGGQQQAPSSYPSYPSQQYYGDHPSAMQQQQQQQQSYGGAHNPPAAHRSPSTAASPHEGSHLSYPYPSAAPPAHYLPSHMPNQAPTAPAPGGVMLPPRNTSAGSAPAPTTLPMPPSSTPAGSAYSPYESHGPRSPTGGHSTHTFSATPSSIPNSNNNNAPPIQQPHHPHPSASPHHHHHPLQQLPRDGPMFIRLGTTASGSLEVNARSDNPRGLSSVQSTWIDPKESGTGGARHVCELCHRTFDRPSTLRTHMNAHTGSKPYLCSKCGRGFGASSNMRRHERSCREAGPGQSPQSPGSNAST